MSTTSLVKGPPWRAVAVASLPVIAGATSVLGTTGIRVVGWALGVGVLFAALGVKRADALLHGPRYVGRKTMRVVTPILICAALAVIIANAVPAAIALAR